MTPGYGDGTTQASGIALIREVLAFAAFKGAPGTAAEKALDELIAERDRLRRDLALHVERYGPAPRIEVM